MHRHVGGDARSGALASRRCGGGTRDAATAMLAPVTARVATAEARRDPSASSSTAPSRPQRMSAVSSRVMAIGHGGAGKAGDLVQAGPGARRDRPADGARARRRRPAARSRRRRPGFALAERNYQRFQALAEDRLGLGARARHGPDAVRAGEGRRPAGDGRGRGRLVRRAGVARRRAVRRAGRDQDGRAGDLAAPGPAARDGRVDDRPPARRSRSPRRVVAASGLAAGADARRPIDARRRDGELTGARRRDDPRRRPGEPLVHRRRSSSAARPSPTGLSGRAALDDGTRERPSSSRARPSSQQGGVSHGRGPRRRAGKARSRAVTLGSALGTAGVEVLSGLAGGEDVLVGVWRRLPPDGASRSEARASERAAAAAGPRPRGRRGARRCA